jgi:retron-type reverse transcriptase
MPWHLAVKAIQAVTDLPWVVLYVRRWLAAPLALPDGTLQQRNRGTPQGGLCAASHKGQSFRLCC